MAYIIKNRAYNINTDEFNIIIINIFCDLEDAERELKSLEDDYNEEYNEFFIEKLYLVN